MKLLEITQDAAAVLEYSNTEYSGIYTDNISTCIIHYYKFENELVVIHDSNQLSLASICEFLRPYGKPRETKYFLSDKASLQNIDRHRARLSLVFSDLQLGEFTNDLIEMNPYYPFAFEGMFDSIKYYSQPLVKSNSVHELPLLDKRIGIIELNNCFSPANSQSLKLDVQFDAGEYKMNTKLNHSVSDMLNLTKQQIEHFGANSFILLKAYRAGAIELPSVVVNALEHHCDLKEFSRSCLEAFGGNDSFAAAELKRKRKAERRLANEK